MSLPSLQADMSSGDVFQPIATIEEADEDDEEKSEEPSEELPEDNMRADKLWTKAQDAALAAFTLLDAMSKTHGISVSFGMEAQAVDKAWARCVKVKNSTYARDLLESKVQCTAAAERLDKVRFFTASEADELATKQAKDAMESLARVHQALEKIDTEFGNELRAIASKKLHDKPTVVPTITKRDGIDDGIERRRRARGHTAFVCPPIRPRGRRRAIISIPGSAAAKSSTGDGSASSSKSHGSGSAKGSMRKRLGSVGRRVSLFPAMLKTEDVTESAEEGEERQARRRADLAEAEAQAEVRRVEEVRQMWPTPAAQLVGSTLKVFDHIAAREIKAQAGRTKRARAALAASKTWALAQRGEDPKLEQWRASTRDFLAELQREADSQPTKAAAIKGASVDAFGAWKHVNLGALLDARAEHEGAGEAYTAALGLLAQSRSDVTSDADVAARAAVMAHAECNERAAQVRAERGTAGEELENAARKYRRATLQMALRKPHLLRESRAHLGHSCVLFERAMELPSAAEAEAAKVAEAKPSPLEAYFASCCDRGTLLRAKGIRLDRLLSAHSCSSEGGGRARKDAPARRRSVSIGVAAEHDAAAAKIQARFRGKRARTAARADLAPTRAAWLEAAAMHAALALVISERESKARSGGLSSAERAEAHMIAAAAKLEVGALVGGGSAEALHHAGVELPCAPGRAVTFQHLGRERRCRCAPPPRATFSVRFTVWQPLTPCIRIELAAVRGLLIRFNICEPAFYYEFRNN